MVTIRPEQFGSFERQAMAEALRQTPPPRVLVCGIVAHTLPQAFAGLEVTVLRGEPEQLVSIDDDDLPQGTQFGK